MATRDNLIEVKDLQKHYHGGAIKALAGVTTEIHPGDVCVVIGPSGSGKSTFLRSLNLLEEPTGGTIIFEGTDITRKKYKDENGKTVRLDVDKLRQKMGMVFQHFNLFPHMTILENMTLAPMKVRGMSREEAEQKALELLDRVGLKDRADAYPIQLSGGQKQRVAIAGVVAMQPKCIVLDEPTAMLDPNGRKEVLEAVSDLNKQEGVTVILITHYMEEVVRADKVYVMDSGEVVMQGTPREIFSQVETLKEYRLDVPQVTLLAHELHKAGVDIPEGILTTEELVNALCL